MRISRVSQLLLALEAPEKSNKAPRYSHTQPVIHDRTKPMSKNANKAAAKRRAAKKHRREVSRGRAKRGADAVSTGAPIYVDQGLPEAEKLSNRVLEMARPLLLECRTDSERYNMTQLAVFAWNQGADPALDVGAALRADIPDRIEAEPRAYEDALELMNVMTKRRQELYPRDRRVITGCEISVSGRDVSLFVVHELDSHGLLSAVR